MWKLEARILTRNPNLVIPDPVTTEDVLVTEDGTEDLVGEDGSTPLIPESED